MAMRRTVLAGVAALALIQPGAGLADETQAYTYDVLGRLIAVQYSGTINAGQAHSICYDAAGNRTTYKSDSAGALASCAGGGGGGGGGSSFAINDASATEGSAVTFSITRSGSTATSQAVSYASASGTATSGTDFTAASGTLTFAIGETSKTVSVTTTQDASAEGTETFALNLSNATGGATISHSAGLGTINDDDVASPPSFAIDDVSVTEGGNLVFTVTKTGSTSSSFTVNYATSNGSAVSGSDYTSASGTLTFLAADTTKTITIATIDDSSVESAETVNVTLSAASGGASISDALGIGTINDNDTAPPNNPPVANPDSITLQKCASGSKDVIANDTDPDGHTPLTLVSVYSDLGWAYVASGTTVGIYAPDTDGVYTATYTVQDSLGATSNGTLTLTVSGGPICQ